MALPPEVTALVARLNTRTNEISEDVTAVQTRIQALLDRPAPVTPAEVEAFRAELASAIDGLDAPAAALDAMGKVVDNPIPPPTPEEARARSANRNR